MKQTLLVDSREASSNPFALIQLKDKLPDVEIDCSTQLQWGDYGFQGSYSSVLDRKRRVGVEVATPSDVWGKIDSNRLAYQLSGMLQDFDVVILHIASPVNRLQNGKIYVPGVPQGVGDYARLMDVLQSAQAHGIIVNYGPGYETVGESIAKLYAYWQKPEDEHTYFRPMTVVREVVGPNAKQRTALSAASIPLGKPLERRTQTMMTFPGIGEDRAYNALIAAGGSLWMLWHLSDKELLKIPGWGKETVARFKAYMIETLGGDDATAEGPNDIAGIDFGP